MSRNNTFDFLRLIAAVVVVVGHSTTELGATFYGAPVGGIDGVGMFFVMSGMLVWLSGQRAVEVTGHWREYFRNRYLRVAPAIYAYTATVLLLLVAIGAVAASDVFTPGIAVWLLGSALLAPNYDPAAFADFGTGILNGPLWSIPAEVSYYIALPFMFWFARRWGVGRMLLLAVPVTVIAPTVGHLAGGAIENVLHHTFLERSAYFAVGIAAANYWKRIPQSPWIFAGMFATWMVLTPIVHDNFYRPFVLAIPLGYSVLWFGFHGPQALQRFTNRIGDLSFGTYIWHMPIINLYVDQGWGIGKWWATPSVIVASVAAGAASWWLVERRALAFKRVSLRETPRAVQPA